MNHVSDKLPDLVALELEAANKEHPPFHSLHEGFAVLREELDESDEALKLAIEESRTMWRAVKRDDAYDVRVFAFAVRRDALAAAAEAIQVAAMATKLIEFIDKEMVP